MPSSLDYINETLHELVLKVFSGVDYVSKIALETGKSIPVVHRQLDGLVKAKVLVRERRGKRVIYAINWQRMADAINSAIALDYESVLAQQHDAILMPQEQFSNATEEFLANPYARSLLQRFFERAGASALSTRRSFTETMQQFLDVLGMLSTAEREKLAKKISASANVKAFLRYCAIRYERRAKTDLRAVFLTDLKKEF